MHLALYPGHVGGGKLASSPGLTPKIGKGAWLHFQKFLYVPSQQSSFRADESHFSITNY